MEGRIVPYLKEVGLADNLPGQLQGTYVAAYLHASWRTILESTPRVECTQVTSVFRLAMSIFTLRKQLRRHQVLMHSQIRYKFFAACVARVQWHTQVFLKFKSSCTVLRHFISCELLITVFK